jgi:hypothetical protein
LEKTQQTGQTPAPGADAGLRARVWRWFDRSVLDVGREMRLSYLPPLMVYMAAGVSGLTSIVGTFFAKDYLDLSAAFLAGLAFWAGIPWALKMVVGHVVDLIWRWKAALVYVGATLIAASLAIMVLLIRSRAEMAATMPVGAWYVLSSLLAPIGYVIQDAVADAMTVEAVPRVDEQGRPLDPERRKLMHTTMQTLGRVAIVGGSVLVALINLLVFAGADDLPDSQRGELYAEVYAMALVIPVLSVLGVISATLLRIRDRRALVAGGTDRAEADRMLLGKIETPPPNAWILGGGLVYVVLTIAVGTSGVPYSAEIVFSGSFAIVTFLVARLTRELDPAARSTLFGTVMIIFVFRALPTPGPAIEWWMIDRLDFDEQFFSVLSLTASALTLCGMFLFRRFMAERSITYLIGFLTIASTLLSLPIIAMYYGLHEWTARVTGGIVDARFIALVDTAVSSPFGEIAMIPLLAWIARCAPSNLKATFFAIMASFTNLALSLAQLGTKYLNQIFTVTREVRDPLSGVVQTPADYTQLGHLLIAQTLIGLIVPFAAILAARLLRLRTD